MKNKIFLILVSNIFTFELTDQWNEDDLRKLKNNFRKKKEFGLNLEMLFIILLLNLIAVMGCDNNFI